MPKQQSSNGINFPGALTIAFIVLKLTHTITWSWWWVLSPFWIVASFIVFVFLGIFAFTYGREWLYDRRTWRRRRRIDANWNRR